MRVQTPSVASKRAVAASTSPVLLSPPMTHSLPSATSADAPNPKKTPT